MKLRFRQVASSLSLLVMVGILSAADPVRRADPPQPTDPAQLPAPTQKLRKEAESLIQERQRVEKELEDDGAAAAAERAVMKAKLLDVLEQLKNKKMMETKASTKSEGSKRPPEKLKAPFPDLVNPPDALCAAVLSFRLDEIDASLKAFQAVDLTNLSREDKIFVEYMTACCLRKQGKFSEAAVKYREVAESKDDLFLAECAKWQLATLTSVQELQAQLQLLRSRRKSQ